MRVWRQGWGEQEAEAEREEGMPRGREGGGGPDGGLEGEKAEGERKVQGRERGGGGGGDRWWGRAGEGGSEGGIGRGWGMQTEKESHQEKERVGGREGVPPPPRAAPGPPCATPRRESAAARAGRPGPGPACLGPSADKASSQNEGSRPRIISDPGPHVAYSAGSGPVSAGPTGRGPAGQPQHGPTCADLVPGPVHGLLSLKI